MELTNSFGQQWFGDEAYESKAFVVLLPGNVFGDEVFVFEPAAMHESINLRVRNRVEITAQNTEQKEKDT